MDKTQHKLTKQPSNFSLGAKKIDRKSMIIGSIVGTLIATTPFIFYSYESVPNTKVWNTFLFTYESGYYQNAQTAMWILMMKFMPLLLLLIWFFTCRHWWYHALLVPISMFTFQVVAAFHTDKYMDEFHIFYLLPIMCIVIPSIYLIRAKIFDKVHTANQTMQELEDEFRLGPKGLWEKIRQYF